MIVRDEQAHLEACVRPVRAIVDEIVIVDTGSRDGTLSVARNLGARVLEFPWIEDFAAARNESLRHATGRWIFWLDADDRIDDANVRKLAALLGSLEDELAGYMARTVCVQTGSGSLTHVDHMRVFPNHPGIRWVYRVHEQIAPSLQRLGGEVRRTDVTIHHAGYHDPVAHRQKLERNLALIERDRREQPDDPFVLFNLGRACMGLGRTAEAVPLWQEALRRCPPDLSIARKLHALLTRGLMVLGRHRDAIDVCRSGLARWPDDAELGFLEGVLHHELGDRAAAERSLERLLASSAARYTEGMDAGLRTYQPLHRLGVLCWEQGRRQEAERHWRAALSQQPDFHLPLLGLAHLYLSEARWPELDEALAVLADDPALSGQAAALAGRARRQRDA
jgi:tetratricopeptide (TPR) repeat protein